MPMTANVKVMRSHDYCHFEINLGADNIETLEQVDELRKKAARLVDKAVDQYKVMKQNAQLLERDGRNRMYEVNRIANIRETPERDRTPEDMARLKAFEDHQYQERRRYAYEDDWNEEDRDDGLGF